MSNEVNLKDKNKPYLWVMFCFNIAILISFFFAAHMTEIEKDIKILLSYKIGIPMAGSLVLFLINGLLPADVKAILVFWRIKNPLPGSRAFSVHGPKDPRVDLTKLASLYGPLPTTAKEQNLLWYKLYKINKMDISVSTSHKQYLLARDVTSMAAIFIIGLGFPALFWGKYPYNWQYILILLVEFILFALVGRNYGKQFVTNVLAVEASK
jgi:hypothetical protein